MKLRDLINHYSFKEIKKRMIEIYPDQKRNLIGYKKVFSDLKKIKPQETKLQLLLETIKEKGEKTYIDVSGIEKTERLAIEYISWKEWLGMEIEKKTNKLFSEIDIICHSLWEMTYAGFTQKEIQKGIKKMESRKMEILKSIKFPFKPKGKKNGI